MAETNVLNIVGEQVTLTDSGMPQRENFFVSFDPYYKFPNITADEETRLKRGLQVIFGKAGIFTDFKPPSSSSSNDVSANKSFFQSFLEKVSHKPVPPCMPEDKSLIIKSLTHRFNILRAQILKEKERDSVRFREITNHAYVLRDYIDYFMTTRDCTEGDGELLESIGELDDDRIKALLQQFIFMILQGQNPIGEYEKKGGLTPAQMIQKLEDGFDPENFDKFIGDYRAKKFPIAERVSKVLQVTELDINAIKGEIEAEIQKRTAEIIAFIQTLIPETDDFWEGINKNDLKSLFDRLLERLKAREAEIVTLKEDVRRKKEEIDAAAVREERNQQEIADLKARIASLEAELAAAKAEAGEKGTSSSGFKAALDAANAEIDRLRGVVEALTEENKKCKETQADTTTLAGMAARLRIITVEVETLRIKVKDCDEIKAENERLKAELEALRASAAKVTVAEGQCDALKAELEAAKKAKVELEAELAKARSDSAEEKSALEAKIAALMEKKAAGEAETQTEIDTEVEAAKAELEKLRAAAAGDKETIDGLLAEKMAAEEKIRDLIAELAKAKAELEAAKKDCDEAKTALQAQLGAAQAENDSLKGQLAEATKKIQEHIDEIGRLKKLLDVEKRSMGTNTSNLDAEVAAANAALQGELERLRGLLANAEKERDAALAAVEAAKNDCDEKVAGLEKTLAEAKAEIDRLKAELDAAKAELDAAKAETDANKKDCDEKVAALEKALAEAKAAADDLVNRVRTLEAEKAALESKATAGEKDRAELEGLRAKAADLEKLLDGEREKVKGLEADRAADADKFAADLAAIKKDCDEKAAAAATASEEEKKKLQDEIDRLAEEKARIEGERDAALAEKDKQIQEAAAAAAAERQDLGKQLGEAAAAVAELEKRPDITKDDFGGIVKEIAGWIRDGAKEADKPVLDPQSEPQTALGSVIGAVDELMRARAADTGCAPQLASLKTAIRSNYCHLVFFSSYMMARHFPPLWETKKQTVGYIIENKFIYSVIESTLNGRKSEKVRGSWEPPGVYRFMRDELKIKDTDSPKVLLDFLIKILDAMEHIHVSVDYGVYELTYLKFNEQQKKIMGFIQDQYKATLGILQTNQQSFEDKLKIYWRGHNGDADKDSYNLFMRNGINMKGEKTDGTTVLLVFEKETTGPNVPLKAILYNTAQQLYKSTENNNNGIKDGVIVDEGVRENLRKNRTFSYPFLFYIYLFVVRDFLDYRSTEVEDLCPLPEILKRRM